MNKKRRELVKTMLAKDPTLSPKDAYDLTKKFKFAGPLKKALTEKGLDVSQNRAFTQEELATVQETMREMLAARESVTTETENANPDSGL